jgi:enolase
MIVPMAPTMSEAVRVGAETYHALRDLLRLRGYRVAVGDEGGFAPQLPSTEDALALLVEAIERAGYQPGEQVALALDFAANDFYREGVYHFEGSHWTAEEMTTYCLQLADRFPIVSMEDGLAEDDWDGWVGHTARLKARGVQCVGDDIFVTNPAILSDGIRRDIATAVLIKLNQIGTLTETIETMRIARKNGYGTVVSHRSGETDDPFIADFAVATAAGQMKAGAPARGERVAKYNQLLRLADERPDVRLATADLYGR